MRAGCRSLREAEREPGAGQGLGEGVTAGSGPMRVSSDPVCWGLLGVAASEEPGRPLEGGLWQSPYWVTAGGELVWQS